MLTTAQILLGVVLLAACWTDWRARKIPNVLIAVGLIAAISASVLGVSGLSLGSALAGAGVGLLIFLPLYAFRAVGAGDVKLLSVVGAWLGMKAVAWVAVYTAMSGMVLAVLVLALHGGWRKAWSDTVGLFKRFVWRLSGVRLSVVENTGGSVRLPYAIAITMGTVLWWIKGSLLQ